MTSETDQHARFRAAYDAGRGALAWRLLAADLITPVAAFLKLAHGTAHSFLLESVEGGAARGRYSVIGFAPDLIWRCDRGQVSVNRDPAADAEGYAADPRPAFESLRDLIAATRLDLPDHLPPMTGGLVGYLGYDMVRLMEELPAVKPDVLGIPDAVLMRPGVFAIFDSVRDEITLAAPVWPRAGVSAAEAWSLATGRIEAAMAALDRPTPALPGHAAPAGPATSNMSEDEFRAMVLRGKDYIAAGDVFQVVASQRFEQEFTLPPFALYRSLRRINPAPFLFFLDFGAYQAVGSSPEILVRLRDGTVTIRPLAGTRRRGATRAEDEALETELLEDPKERAEHLMLLDLARNDVGRVAEIGSVNVTESFVIERFSHVMHISSNVEGRIRPEADALDALIAGFPAGTLSGAPKVRAMEIIEEFEPSRRGLYGGCIGYFAANGTMDTCIALRTALIRDGRLYVQAGVGIVADSDPDAELAESHAKARALFRAAEDAGQYVTPNEAPAR
ncbi:anthranilate synthase component I [Acidiphilium multivorum AIU301]|uniref:Anthranilate synthase component 1 n=1 Tax=Acidiphilium multivorum (strain DSM 11245 / JCM 8867 / NBRC 100883 / AIU 301) TaxID=926570 RepID=F0IXW2_ACIMA|nr:MULTISPECIES: anthranilate synthase component I [Acidiphilium]BAJ80622.1 anthranilate synthase component I [Acidiphilium multivorum AIU301]GAN74466.1 anthranilate/para-aminobenzoate synthase component I [Acidiphilium multivorum AIU301]